MRPEWNSSREARATDRRRRIITRSHTRLLRASRFLRTCAGAGISTTSILRGKGGPERPADSWEFINGGEGKRSKEIESFPGEGDRAPREHRLRKNGMRSGTQRPDPWIRAYLNRVFQSPRPTREEEERLGQRIQSGDKEALRALVEAHLYLVVCLAQRFARLGASLADLIQEGNLALVEAATRFDGRRGQRFSTYAAWWVRHALQRVLMEQNRGLYLPTYRRRQLASLRKERRSLAQRLGREPTPQEIARGLGWPLNRVLQDLPLLEAPVSLEGLVPDDDFEKLVPALEVPDPDEALAPRLRREVLQQLVDRLPERERTVLRMRYGLDGEPPRTMREVARRLGLTAEGVRQVELRALAKLRRPAWLARLRDLAG